MWNLRTKRKIKWPGSSNYVPFQVSNGCNDTAATSVDDNGAKDLPATENRLINEKGVCGNCSMENATEDSVCCFLYKNIYHAVCFSFDVQDNKTNCFPENTCSKTVLKQFNTNAASKRKAKKFGSFDFFVILA
jgi:hypothetical protein